MMSHDSLLGHMTCHVTSRDSHMTCTNRDEVTRQEIFTADLLPLASAISLYLVRLRSHFTNLGEVALLLNGRTKEHTMVESRSQAGQTCLTRMASKVTSMKRVKRE